MQLFSSEISESNGRPIMNLLMNQEKKTINITHLKKSIYIKILEKENRNI